MKLKITFYASLHMFRIFESFSNRIESLLSTIIMQLIKLLLFILYFSQYKYRDVVPYQDEGVRVHFHVIDLHHVHRFHDEDVVAIQEIQGQCHVHDEDVHYLVRQFDVHLSLPVDQFQYDQSIPTTCTKAVHVVEAKEKQNQRKSQTTKREQSIVQRRKFLVQNEYHHSIRQVAELIQKHIRHSHDHILVMHLGIAA